MLQGGHKIKSTLLSTTELCERISKEQNLAVRTEFDILYFNHGLSVAEKEGGSTGDLSMI